MTSLVLILEASFPYWRMLICTARSLCLLHSCRQSETSSSSLSSIFFLSSSELLSNLRLIQKLSCMFCEVSKDLPNVCSPLELWYSIIHLSGHCITTWYAMFRTLVKLMEIGTSWGAARQ